MSNRGFTLLEVVIVIGLIAISFSVLFEIASHSVKQSEEAERLFRDLIFLDRKLKEGNLEGLKIEQKRNPDYPRIIEKRYFYRDLFMIKVETR